MGGCGDLESFVIFNIFYIWKGVLVLKELILTDFTLERCGCLDSTNFQQFLIWKGMVILKEHVLTISHLGGSGGLERTDI